VPTPAAREALAARFLHLLPRPQLAALLAAAGVPPTEAADYADPGAGPAGLPPSLRAQFRLAPR
jgi:hypothetical protein